MRLADNVGAMLTGEKLESPPPGAAKSNCCTSQNNCEMGNSYRFDSDHLLACSWIFSLSCGSSASPLSIHFQYKLRRLIHTGVMKGTTEREGKMFREDLGDGESLEMVEIPSGNFWMGSSQTEFSNIVKELQRVGLPIQQAQELAKQRLRMVRLK